MEEINIINRKRCIIAFIISVLIVVASFFAIVVLATLPATNTVNIVGMLNFRYFTVLSNLLMNICAVLCIPFEIDGLRYQNYHLPRWIIDLLYFGVVNMAITFFTCLFVIAPINGFKVTFFSNTNFYLHIMCPVLSLLLFLSINVDHKIEKNRIIISCIPILIYTVVYTIEVFVIGEDNGGWFDHYFIKDNIPLWQIVIIIMIITITFASILLHIHNLQHNRYKNKVINIIRNNKNIDIIEDIKKIAYEQRKKYKEGNIVIPTHIIDVMQKEYGKDYTNEELYKIFLNNYLDSKS